MSKKLKKIKLKKKKEAPDEFILETHITEYLDKSGSIIFWMLLAISIAEIIIYILLHLGYFSYYLEQLNNVNLSYFTLIGESGVKLILIWLIFSFYLILYKKANFKHKKILICTVILIITTIISFGHWKYNYLSILYSIPVVFTCPLGKKTQKVVLTISIIMSIIYSAFQYLTFKTENNFLVAIVTVLTLFTFYIICSSFYSSMTKAFNDMGELYKLSTKLSDEVSHDYVTGAFSKAVLNQDLVECKELKSIAFIDLDNFKNINDTKGHSVGDHILKNIVRCFNSRRERIYRYGGDEFVILSELPVDELVKKIEMVKIVYNNSSKTLFSCDATFSAGVMPINGEDDSTTLLKKCDEVMYISKHEGKNKISVK